MFPTGYAAYAPYGSLSLAETSPVQSFVEPLSLQEVKDYLVITDTDRDTLLAAFISGAREQAEILQGRDLVRKQWDLSLDYWLTYQIKLRDPLVSVDLVKYRDSDGNYTTLAENTDFVVDAAKHPGVVVPMYGTTWPSFTPWPSSAILLRFTSGLASNSVFWSDAGARVKQGMKYLISHWNDERLPFIKGAGALAEYPYTVTALLSQGSVPRVR